MDLTPVWLVVNGQPVPWERARRKGGRYFLSERQKDWRERVVTGWRVEGRPLLEDAALELEMLFVFERSERERNARFPKPDLDNLAKGVLDALNNLLYDDDCQVVRFAGLEKRWAHDGEEPHASVKVTPLCPDVGT